MKETDLFEPVKHLLLNKLQQEKVYAEVNNYDVFSIKDNLYTIVEMKLSLNFKVIQQAFRALEDADFVYIAVPKPKTYTNDDLYSFAYFEFLQRKNIGIIYIEKNKYSKEMWDSLSKQAKEDRRMEMIFEQMLIYNEYPEYVGKIAYEAQKNPKNRHKTQNIEEIAERLCKEEIGGVPGGKLNSDYSLIIKNIKEYLEVYGESSVREITENVPGLKEYYKYSKNKEASVRATLNASWNDDWIKLTKIKGKNYYTLK